MQVVEIQGKAEWHATQDPESGRWVAICPALALTVEEDQWQDLAPAMMEAMQLLLEDLLRADELEAYLQARGWRPVIGRLRGLDPDDDVSFAVPYELLHAARPHDLPHAVAQ